MSVLQERKWGQSSGVPHPRWHRWKGMELSRTKAASHYGQWTPGPGSPSCTTPCTAGSSCVRLGGDRWMMWARTIQAEGTWAKTVVIACPVYSHTQRRLVLLQSREPGAGGSEARREGRDLSGRPSNAGWRLWTSWPLHLPQDLESTQYISKLSVNVGELRNSHPEVRTITD